VVVRSKALVSGRSLAAIAGSNPAGAWISLSCVGCVVKGAVSAMGCSLVQMNPKGCGVSECDREVPIMRRPWSCPTRSCCAVGRKIGLCMCEGRENVYDYK